MSCFNNDIPENVREVYLNVKSGFIELGHRMFYNYNIIYLFRHQKINGSDLFK